MIILLLVSVSDFFVSQRGRVMCSDETRSEKEAKFLEVVQSWEQLSECASTRNNGRNVSILTIAGELNPNVYDELKEAMENLLREGVSMRFLFGPIVLVDDAGKNPIFRLAAKYPEQVVITRSKMRIPHHYHLIVVDTVPVLAVREVPHLPLAEKREQ